MATKQKAKVHTLTHLETGVVYQFHPNGKVVMVKLTARKRSTNHSMDVEEGRFLYKHLRTNGYVRV